MKFKFNIEDIVYLKTDIDQHERMVTGIFIRPGEKITYELSLGEFSSDHYEIEISREKNILKTFNN